MSTTISRRRLLGAAAATALMPSWARARQADNGRILVVLELSGGNDGLNTVVPHADDTYYRLRPTIGIGRGELLPLDDHWGFNPGALGLKRLWDAGELAIVHGAGYDNPVFSHFTSMAYWHTAAPGSGAAYGWVGRLADALAPDAPPAFLVNVASSQSLAVVSRRHTPVVFDDPERFQRSALQRERAFLAARRPPPAASPTLQFVRDAASSAAASSELVRAAWSSYRTPVDYGIAPMDLPKVAACINHGVPARLYYVSVRNNAFDTHVQQNNLHRRLLSYAADAVHGFMADMKRIGAADRVTLLAFSEFGRRAGENANAGTDHGSANLMLLAGAGVHGGHYGTPPSLANLRDDGNLVHTLDFRRVYATAIDWLAPGLAPAVLGAEFETLPVFGGDQHRGHT